MNRLLWLDPFFILFQLALYFCPPFFVAVWLAHLITRHYGLGHHSAAGHICLIALIVLLVAVWIVGLMRANKLWNAHQDRRNNQ